MEKKNEKNEIADFTKWFRQTLLEAGYSPDAHLSQLTPVYLFTRVKNESVRRLIKIRLFLEGLSETERRVFVNDILERERHYPFWYYGTIEEEEREQLVDELLSKAIYAMRCTA